MAIDNVLLLLLVPWAGAASDRASAAAAAACRSCSAASSSHRPWHGAVRPSSVRRHCGRASRRSSCSTRASISQRSPVQALHRRSRAVALPLARHRLGDVSDVRRRGRVPDARTNAGDAAAFLVAAVTVLAIAAAFVFALREPAGTAASSASVRRHVPLDRRRGPSSRPRRVPGMRAVFLASLLVQLTFQTFTTWYHLHGTERFGVGPRGRHRSASSPGRWAACSARCRPASSACAWAVATRCCSGSR